MGFMCSSVWTTGKFPEDWTLATIIPIPKPGKDPAEPNNYRPIALTSFLCKTLERMINKRLTWFLEYNNHISRFQSGFRSDRSTTDNLVRLETFIRDSFIKMEHVVAVFFDLEKAYDTTWRYGILKDIHKLGLRGRLPTFIENFLADRTMQVESAPLCLTIMTRSNVYLKEAFYQQHFLALKLMIL